MENEKIETVLNLALQSSGNELEQDESLLYGYDREKQNWKVIVKYYGEIKRFEMLFSDTSIVELFNQYAIITTKEKNLEAIAAMPEIEFMEKPKRFYFNLEGGRAASCVNSIQKSQFVNDKDSIVLTGKGVLVGIVDSGIDFFHPGFQNMDGTTRIAYLWDQSATNKNRIPAGYDMGAEYTNQDINRVLQLKKNNQEIPEEYMISGDRGTGHGTAVAGVAAGNGAGSPGNKYRGIATESELVVVKLGRSNDEFAGSTEIMEGIDYIIQKAIDLQKPVVINLSFGNNYGPHDGQSLFENYISQLNGIWKNVIVVASGNEGDARHHAFLDLKAGAKEILFAVGEREKTLSLQIWKQFVDEFELELESPTGNRIRISNQEQQVTRLDVSGTTILTLYGSPTPYSIAQEVYMEWIAKNQDSYLEQGIWKLYFIPKTIRDGRVNLWLPTVEAIGLSTGFLTPDSDTTLTIPSTARNIITVGAYRSDNDSIASFSGRGDTVDNRQMPTLVAPGVGIITAAVGGGYEPKTGTSIAAPFVTGGAALLMEWGIVQGNDAYLYGEKVKSYLIKGARELPISRIVSAQSGINDSIPNKITGWGALCVRDSIPV